MYLQKEIQTVIKEEMTLEQKERYFSIRACEEIRMLKSLTGRDGNKISWRSATWLKRILDKVNKYDEIGIKLSERQVEVVMSILESNFIKK